MTGSDLHVFGDSILWGQGHRTRNKIHTRIARLVRRRTRMPVYVHQHAHSGATVLGAGGHAWPGEIPSARPTVAEQIRRAPRAGRRDVRILIDGGINDVQVFRIINPACTTQEIIHWTRASCYRDMKRALLELHQKYPGADTYVTGYFQILADRPSVPSVGRLLNMYGIRTPRNPRASFIDRAVENTRVFWKASDKALAQAVREVAAQTASRFTFVPSGFTGRDGLFGWRSLLYPPGVGDPKAWERFRLCPRYKRRGPDRAWCYFAATGHPNRRGVDRYVRSLASRVQ